MSPSKKLTTQEQEELVIDSAVKCIEKSTLLDFTMSAISKEAGISMGSVYKHVQSKEDVLVAVATRVIAHQHNAFSEIMNAPLTLPERLICHILTCPIKLNLYSFGIHLQMLTGNEAVLKRASPRWLERLMRLDQSCNTIFKESFYQAIESGELELDKDSPLLASLNLGLWSMAEGYFQIAFQRQARFSVGGGFPLPFPLPVDHPQVISMQRLINIYPWIVPLSADGIQKAYTFLENQGFR